ncbi:MAG: PilZ domain-containing protein [Candidatus Omnitrophota bacterium]
MKMKLPERRRFIRIEIPLKVIIKSGDRVDEIITKNISPVGLRFEILRALKGSEKLDLALHIPSTDNPIPLKAKVIWQTKTSLEDNAPYDVGVEITDIDDKTKNIFLKYLCDLLYDSTYMART